MSEMKKKLFLIWTILLTVCFAVGVVKKAAAEQDAAQKIYAGVYLDSVYVGGLTKEQAMEEYDKYIDGIDKLNLTFKTSKGTYSTTLGEVNVSVSLEDAVEQAYNYGRQGNILSRYKEIKALEEENAILIPKKEFDENKLKEKLETETTNLVTEPENASIKREDGEFIVYDGVVGETIDAEATVKEVKALFEKEWEQKSITMDAVVKKQEPTYTKDDFYAIDSVLGQFATEYIQGDTNRSRNLATGAAKISGTVLMPGEQFSTYKTVSPFTEENGYADAGQYVDNELVKGLGGGICQVSTTLYNAVLFAELQVDERYPHSLTVGYVKLGRDAAIAGDYMDFKFTNDTEYPIYIEGYAGGGTISFAIYGHETRPANRRIEFESKVISEKEPGEPEEIKDKTLEKGKTITEQSAHTGYYVELWKHVYIDDELTDSYKVAFGGSSYTAQAAKIRVGTKKKKKEVEEDEEDEGDETPETTTEQPPTPDAVVPEAPAEEPQGSNGGE